MSNVVTVQLPTGSTEAGKVKEEGQPTSAAQKDQQPQEQAPQRPDHIPEKFWKEGKVDTDALLKSYSELEKKQGKPAEGKPAEGKPAEGKQSAESPKGEQSPEEAFQPFFDEFAKDGKLSDTSYEKLAKEFKLPRAVVDSYIQQQAQTQAATTKSILDSVGGEDAYSQIAEWARAELPATDIVAYNKILDSGDVAAVKLAVAGLHQKFVAAEGQQGQRLRGSGPTGLTPFKSTADVTEAMRDRRYSTDPDYRKEVEQRIAISDVL